MTQLFFGGEHAFVNWTYSIFFHVSIGVKITKRNHHHPFPSLAMSQGGIWDSMSNIQLRKEFSFWLKKNCLRRCGGLTFRKLTTRKENCKSTQQCLLDALLATTRLSYSKPIYPKVAMLSPLEEYEYTFALACPAFHHLGSNRRHQSVAKQYPSSQYL